MPPYLSISNFTLQEIYKDRKKFSKQVFEVASSDLVNMGITVVSYTLKDIRDEEVRIYLSFSYVPMQLSKYDEVKEKFSTSQKCLASRTSRSSRAAKNSAVNWNLLRGERLLCQGRYLTNIVHVFAGLFEGSGYGPHGRGQTRCTHW